MKSLIVLSDASVVAIISAVIVSCCGIISSLLIYIWNERKKSIDLDRIENKNFINKFDKFCTQQELINRHFEERIEKLEDTRSNRRNHG